MPQAMCAGQLPKRLPKTTPLVGSLGNSRDRREGFVSMARPEGFIRVRQLSNGTLRHVEKGGREVPGLSFHKANASYYSVDPDTGNRMFHSRDVTAAVEEFQNIFEPQEADWVHLDREVEVATVIQNLSHSPIDRVLAVATEPLPKPSKQRLFRLPGYLDRVDDCR